MDTIRFDRAVDLAGDEMFWSLANRTIVRGKHTEYGNCSLFRIDAIIHNENIEKLRAACNNANSKGYKLVFSMSRRSTITINLLANNIPEGFVKCSIVIESFD